MKIEYGIIATEIGLTKLTNSSLGGDILSLSRVKFGDSAGTEYTPIGNELDLKNIVAESEITTKTDSLNGNNWVEVGSFISAEQGPFVVREMGIYDTVGDLIFIGAVSPREKPLSSDHSVDMSFLTVIDLINRDTVNFVIDQNTAGATVKYVNEKDNLKVDKTIFEQYKESVTNWLKLKLDVTSFNIFKKEINDKADLTHSYLVPCWSPILSPFAVCPNTHLEVNGQSFNKVDNPILATAYPSGYLPDMRGESVVGFDNGRGVDAGRKIGSWQDQSVQHLSHNLSFAGNALHGHDHNVMYSPGFTAPAGPYKIPMIGFDGNNAASKTASVSAGTPTGSINGGITGTGTATRSRNVAWMYIVRKG